MSYFDEVYLNRVNRYGNTIQERIQNKREHDFLTMMNKSPNKVTVDKNNLSFEGVLQTKTYDEDEIVDYLLTPIGTDIKMGELLWVTDIRHGRRINPFMSYAIDPYTTSGYDRHTVIELEETLRWVVDGVYHRSRVHVVGGGSGARDKNINLKFRMQFSEAGVYLPNKRYSIVMPAEGNKEFLTKNTRVTLGGETWRVTGFDQISVNGVLYVTLEEAQTDSHDDVPIANREDRNGWYFTTDIGEEFNVGTNGKTIKILSYYKGKEQDSSNLNLSVSGDANTKVSKTKNGYLIESIGNYGGPAEIKVNLLEILDPLELDIEEELEIKDELNIIQTIPFNFVRSETNKITVSGPSILFVEDEAKYKISGEITEDEFNSICGNNSNIQIIDKSYEDKTLKVKGNDIGKTDIMLDDEKLFEINVQSIWLGGLDNGNS